MERSSPGLIEPGTLDVQTRGGQLSRATEWTLLQSGLPVCQIERVNWKWKFWTYTARITIGTHLIDASGAITREGPVVTFSSAQGEQIANQTDASALLYHGASYELTGIESPDTLVDDGGRKLVLLRWRMQALRHIDVLAPLPLELIAIATTGCLLHERPTD